jgi:hypothetical protein
MGTVGTDNDRMSRAPRHLPLLVVLGAVFAGACGDSKYTYLANGDEQTYLRVPKAWKTFELSTERADRIDPQYAEDVELLWNIALDAGDGEGTAHIVALTDLEAEALDDPAGTVSVYQVQGNFAQSLSLTSARAIPLGVDPLQVPDDVKDLVEIIDFQPLAPNDGLQGGRVTFNLRPNDAADWRTYDIVTAFDQTRFRMYVLTVGCSAECFEREQADIDEVVSSWKVDR